jgi:two-component system NarL family sensor kinase
MKEVFLYVGVLLIGLPLAGRAKGSDPQRKVDSLQLALAHQTKPDTNRVQTLVRLAKALYPTNQATATQRAAEGLALAKQLSYKRGEAAAAFQVGVFAFERGDLKAATVAFEHSLGLWKQVGAQARIGELQNALASVYGQQGKYGQSVRWFISSLRLAEKTGNKGGQVRALLNIGVTLERMFDEPQAIHYFQQALSLTDTVRDAQIYSTVLTSLANAHLTLKDQHRAMPYVYRALRVARRIGDEKNEGYMHLSLGRLASAAQNWPESQRQLRQALSQGEKVGDAMLLTQSLLWLGDDSRKQRHLTEALANYQQALEIAKQTNIYVDLEQIYAGVARVYAAQRKFPEAYQTQVLQSHYADSATTEKTISEAQGLQVRYDTEKKEARNRLLAAQTRTQQQIIRRRNVQLLAGLLIAGLLLGLGYLLYTRRRLRREVEFVQERQQLERLRSQAVLEAEEAERRRIGSDLHDGVGQLLTVAKLNLHALGEQLHTQTEGQQVMLQNALDVVDESFREVRTISHNLMPNALIKRGLAQAVRDFLSKIAPDDRLKIQLEVVGLDRGGRLDVIVENVLFRVIQELAQNIVKHAQATQMTLQIIRSENELTIMVEDNGVGFTPSALGEEAGIGLKNIESRMAYLGGRAEFDSSPGRGTTVTLEVPLTAQFVAS